ncbi:MAG: hypothetical protein IPN88_12210 [Bacteroidetes bacterium]|nr:hypothetical protein [Bacteroidota bacterium]
MQTYYRKHQGKNPKSIIIKIARKLLNRMLSVIKKETPYQKNYSKEIKADTGQHHAFKLNHHEPKHKIRVARLSHPTGSYFIIIKPQGGGVALNVN